MTLSLSDFAGLILIAYLSVIYGEYRLNDLLVYLPLALYLRNPSLYPGNPLIANLLSMPYPIYRLYALIYNQYIFFAIFLVNRVLLVISLFVLSTRLFRDRMTTWLGLLLVLFTPVAFGTLGATAVLLPDASQQSLAVPWFLLALAASLEGNSLLAFALAGFAFNLHPILGAAALAMLTAQLLICEVWRTRWVKASQAAFYMGFASLLALPTLAVMALGPGTKLVSDPAGFLQVIRFTLYFHLFPSTFTIQEYLTTGLIFVYLLLAFNLHSNHPHRQTILIWLGIVAAFCMIGTIFSEIIPMAFMLKLMPFRSTLFFKVIGLFYAAYYLNRKMNSGRMSDYLIASLSLVGFLINERVLLLGLGLDLFLTYRMRSWGIVGAFGAGLLAALAIWQGRQHTLPPTLLQGIVFDPNKMLGSTRTTDALIACGLIAVVVLASHISRRLGNAQPNWVRANWAWRWINPALSSLVVVVTLLIGAAPSPLSRRIHIPLVSPLNDLEDVARWAQQHTPTATLFITPPDVDMAGFTLFAERNTLGDYKQAGQAVLDPQFASIIYQRLADLGCRGPWQPWCWGNSYASFDAARFRFLGIRYGACEVLTVASHKLELNEVYRNSSYNVYGLC